MVPEEVSVIILRDVQLHREIVQSDCLVIVIQLVKLHLSKLIVHRNGEHKRGENDQDGDHGQVVIFLGLGLDILLACVLQKQECVSVLAGVRHVRLGLEVLFYQFDAHLAAMLAFAKGLESLVHPAGVDMRTALVVVVCWCNFRSIRGLDLAVVLDFCS